MEVIHCFNCGNLKSECSFVHDSWKIDRWLIIKKAVKEITDCTKTETEQKQRAVIPLPVEMPSEAANMSRPVLDPLPSASSCQDTQNTMPEMDNSSGHILERFAESIPGSSMFEDSSANARDEPMDHREILFFQDVSPYEDVLTSPRRTATSLRTAIAILETIRAREQTSLDNHWELVECRQPTIDDLTNRLRLELGRAIDTGSRANYVGRLEIEDDDD